MRTEICIKFKRKWEYIFIACLYVNAVPERNDVTGVEANGLSYPVAIDMRIWNGFYTIPKIRCKTMDVNSNLSSSTAGCVYDCSDFLDTSIVRLISDFKTTL